MQRLRLYDFRNSRLPGAIGVCKEDILSIANAVNSAERRLITAKEAGDEGWWGTWAEMLFTLSIQQPYLTVPRQVARVALVNVCEKPFPIENQWYEYLSFGNGRMPKTYKTCTPLVQQAFSRNNVPTFVDLPTGAHIISIYNLDAADDGKRVLMQGTDTNNKAIYTLDGLNKVTGIFTVMQSPFVNVATQMSSITGIQKDVTQGEVEIHAINPVTGDDTLLLTLDPGETTASYRRYYFSGLPRNCCQGVSTQGTTVSVTALVKLEPIPVVVDTDYIILQGPGGFEAVIDECQAIRYSEMDGESAKRLCRERHASAIGLLNGQLAHSLGTDKPAVNFAPFGSAKLENKAVGRLF